VADATRSQRVRKFERCARHGQVDRQLGRYEPVRCRPVPGRARVPRSPIDLRLSAALQNWAAAIPGGVRGADADQNGAVSRKNSRRPQGERMFCPARTSVAAVGFGRIGAGRRVYNSVPVRRFRGLAAHKPLA